MSQVTMPKMGEAMEEGTLVRWLKKVGDHIEEDEPIAEVETDKTTMEVLPFVTGTIQKLIANEGDTIPVGGVMALVGDGEEAAETAPSGKQVPESEAPPQIGGEPNATANRTPNAETRQETQAAAEAAPKQATLAQAPAQEAERESQPAERPLASPLARKIASDANVDLRAVQGTGPKGRIIEADIRDYLQRVPGEPEAAPATAPAPQPVMAQPKTAPAAPTAAPAVAGETKRLSGMRKVIAKRLMESKQTVPHFYVTTEIDMKAAKEFHAMLKGVEIEGRAKPTLTDMIVKACALGLAKYPDVNAQFQGDSILYPSQINVGIAVSLEEGLIVPVVRGCESKTLHQIARESRPLIEKARAGKLAPEDYSGGTFTVSNLGMYDVENFAAIINPPECAILAVSSIQDQVVALNGEVVIRPRMKVTLSADHRAADGVKAAQFLQEIKRLLQIPFSLVE
jgi:pyruvate dehydrogenase E2 component (dihydrolipoamide acetyltransferase)